MNTWRRLRRRPQGGSAPLGYVFSMFSDVFSQVCEDLAFLFMDEAEEDAYAAPSVIVKVVIEFKGKVDGMLQIITSDELSNIVGANYLGVELDDEILTNNDYDPTQTLKEFSK